MESIFDRQVERRNTGNLKWDVPEGELPMWVADMDFETAPEIRATIMERAGHGWMHCGIIFQKIDGLLWISYGKIYQI